jgi:energy-coupling factor transporter ATP-binding protein EcfA2
MARMIPPELKPKTSTAERLIYEAIRDSKLAKDWTVFHAKEISKPKQKRDEEIDFIVLIPGRGIVLIEAKGATDFDFDENGMKLTGVPDPDKNPWSQVRTAEINLRFELESIELEEDKTPVGRLVWMPRIDNDPSKLSRNRPGRGFMDYEIAFMAGLDNPYQTIVAALEGSIKDGKHRKTYKSNPDYFTPEIIKAITNHFIADYHVSRTVADKHKERERELKKVAARQKHLLDMLRDNSVVYFSGPAGSGKSKILSTLAADSKALGHNVLVTCHNIMMANWMREQLQHLEGVKVIAFDELLLEISGLKAHRKTNEGSWYGTELPAAALKNLIDNSSIQKYSAILVDEFQDVAINDLKLEILFKLQGKSKALESRIYLAGDDNQQIMNGSLPVDSIEVARKVFGPLTHIQLKSNIRQTPALSAAIYKMLDRRSPFQTHEINEDLNDDLEVIHVTKENQSKRLAKVLERLNKDYPLPDLRVLHFDNATSVLTQVFKNAGNLSSAHDRWLAKNCKETTMNPAGEIKWRSIRKFKGLDEDAIVITDISKESAAWVEKTLKRTLDDALYVGMTRARFKLVLLVQDGLYEPTHNADGKKFV